jgi:hypothetical protein
LLFSTCISSVLDKSDFGFVEKAQALQRISNHERQRERDKQNRERDRERQDEGTQRDRATRKDTQRQTDREMRERQTGEADKQREKRSKIFTKSHKPSDFLCLCPRIL